MERFFERPRIARRRPEIDAKIVIHIFRRVRRLRTRESGILPRSAAARGPENLVTAGEFQGKKLVETCRRGKDAVPIEKF
jgi:hypothetical protein